MIDASILLVFLSTFFFSICFFGKIYKYEKNPLPGPLGIPIIGHLPFLGKNPLTAFRKWRKKFGDVFYIRMGCWDTVVINGYKTIKEAMEKHGDDFSGRPHFLSIKTITKMNNVDGLGFGTFNKAYIQHRKLSSNAMRTFTKTDVTVTQELVHEEGDSMIETFLSWNGSPNFTAKVVEHSVGSILYQILYGRHRNIKQDKNLKTLLDFANETTEFAKNGAPLDVMPWLRFFFPKKVSQLVMLMSKIDAVREALVQEHVERINDSGVKGDRSDVTNIYLEYDLPEEVTDQTSTISKKRLVASISELLTAGFETTSNTLKWMILYMIAYPEVQSRVQKELDDIVGCSRKVHLSDRKKLNFTVATILEIMRITSVVPLSLPRMATMNTKLNGISIKEGFVALVNIHSIHMEESFWEDPEVFRPERLLKNNCEIDKEKAKHIVPFGLGRRRCVGEQLAEINIFLLFCNLMQRCTFSAVEDGEIDLNPVPGLVYHPKPFRAIVKQRQ